MKKKFKKSTWLPAALLIYNTVMAIYFVPRNTQISDMEKYITVGAAYLIIGLLWFVLRKQDKRREQQEQDNLNKK